MYEIVIRNKKVENKLRDYINQRSDINEKIDRLKNNPRKELSAHPLHGILKGKLACWLGYNIRMIYKIDDFNKEIIIESIGTHKIY